MPPVFLSTNSSLHSKKWLCIIYSMFKHISSFATEWIYTMWEKNNIQNSLSQKTQGHFHSIFRENNRLSFLNFKHSSDKPGVFQENAHVQLQCGVMAYENLVWPLVWLSWGNTKYNLLHTKDHCCITFVNKIKWVM